jgi:hypothetical protein
MKSENLYHLKWKILSPVHSLGPPIYHCIFLDKQLVFFVVFENMVLLSHGFSTACGLCGYV